MNEKLFQSKKKKYLSINIGVINKIYVERKEKKTHVGRFSRSFLGKLVDQINAKLITKK